MRPCCCLAALLHAWPLWVFNVGSVNVVGLNVLFLFGKLCVWIVFGKLRDEEQRCIRKSLIEYTLMKVRDEH